MANATGPATRPSTKRRIVGIGLATLILTFPVYMIGMAIIIGLLSPKPDLDCNGHTLGPGDVCHVVSIMNGTRRESDETYAQRVAAANGSKTTPLVVVSSAIVAIEIGVAVFLWRGAAQRLGFGFASPGWQRPARRVGSASRRR